MKRKSIIISAVFAVLAVSVIALAVSDTPEGGKEKCDKSYKEKCNKSKKDRDKRRYEKHRINILDHAEELGLSDKQAASIKDIKSAHEKEMIRLDADIDVLEVELKELHRDYDTSMDILSKKIREIERKKGDKRIAKYKMMRDIRKIMTPEQREKFKEIFMKMKSGEK